MVISTESAFDIVDFEAAVLAEYEDAVVYGDVEGEDVLYEGSARLLLNGWVELPTGRVLSPNAVHHIDPNLDGG